MKKIWPLEMIASMLDRENERIGLAHGCWDILHIGHVRHLQLCKRDCNVLIVTITSDQYVNKGPGQPVFSAKVRAEVIAALSCVDFVAINDHLTAADPILDLQPHVYFKGLEFRGRMTEGLEMEAKAAASCGARLEFVGEKLSSSTTLAWRLV